ncbi:MAG: hypothetical protein GX294_08780 [Candidatus Cloacimonetes bacterium]|nr:hypothetical protein [Candidatus Cloacimonadota bacterium]
MRARLIIFLFVLSVAVFFNFYNARKVLTHTRSIDQMEKTVNAAKNIKTELEVEYDDLCSGQNLSSLVGVELNGFIPEQQQERIIYVHEPHPDTAKDSYCIVDLIATKAQAKDVQIIPD